MDTTGVVKFATKIACIVILAIILDAAIWAMMGRLTLESFIRGLEYAGFISILWGLFSVFGGFNARGFDVQYARSVGPDNMHQRARRSVEDLLGSYSDCALFGIAGVLLLAISTILSK